MECCWWCSYFTLLLVFMTSGMAGWVPQSLESNQECSTKPPFPPFIHIAKNVGLYGTLPACLTFASHRKKKLYLIGGHTMPLTLLMHIGMLLVESLQTRPGPPGPLKMATAQDISQLSICQPPCYAPVLFVICSWRSRSCSTTKIFGSNAKSCPPPLHEPTHTKKPPPLE